LRAFGRPRPIFGAAETRGMRIRTTAAPPPDLESLAMHDPQYLGSGRRMEYAQPKKIVWPWIAGSVVLGFGILIASAVVVRYAQEEMEDQNEILERKMRERDARNGIAPKPKKPTIRPRATPTASPTGGAKKAEEGGYEFVGMIPGPKPGTNRPTTRSLDPNAIEPPAIPPRPRPEPIVVRYELAKVEPAASATPSGAGKPAAAFGIVTIKG